MIIEYLKLALRSLTRRKLRAWLTMIGIFIGIAAVVSLIGLGEGLRTAITSQFGFLGPDVLTVQASGMNMMGPPGTASPNPLTKDLAKKIESVNGVDVAINRYIAIGTLEFNNLQGIGFATSMPSGEKRKQLEEIGNIRVQTGRLLKDGDNKAVVVGSSFTKTDNGFGKPIKVGDKILQYFPQVEVCHDPEVSLRGADALALLTDWPEFAHFTLTELRSRLRSGVVLDARGFLKKR